jgi:hypothetical protein
MVNVSVAGAGNMYCMLTHPVRVLLDIKNHVLLTVCGGCVTS